MAAGQRHPAGDIHGRLVRLPRDHRACSAAPGAGGRLVLQGPGLEPAARSLPAALWRQVVNSKRKPRSLGYISRIDYAKADLRRVLATIRLALHESIEDKLPWCECPRWCCGVIVM
jgi:hypothetical protein